MDLSFLTDLGTKFLDTPKGKKLLSGIDVNSLNKEVSKLTSELKSLDEDIDKSPSGIGVDEDDINTNSTLTQDQRRKLREEKREKRKAERKRKREELNKKLEKLKQKLIPRFEEYTLNGRIYDIQTAVPLSGVKVSIGIDQKQLTGINTPSADSLVQIPEELKSVLDDDIKLVADYKQYVPLNFLIQSESKTTDKNGYYSIKVKALVIGEEDENNLGEKRELKSILDLGLSFQKSNFLPNSTPLITGSGKIKSDISTLGLYNIDKGAKKESDDVNNKIYETQTKVNLLFLSGVEKIIVTRRKSVQRVVNMLTQKLIPLLIGILIAFGIEKVSNKDKAVCPSPEALKDAIKRRNRAVRQINQIFTTVIINSGLAAVFLVLANALKSVRLNLDGLPFPLAIGTPPAKDFGGLITATPYTVVAKLQHINDVLEKLEEDNEGLNKQLLISLAFLISGLIVARLLLKTIDELTGKCGQSLIDSGEITLEELNDEINQLSDGTEEETPINPNINGFILSVNNDKREVGTINRRFAVAKNRDGVILLRGEPSFSANDQILIEELKFYITSNNLKAN